MASRPNWLLWGSVVLNVFLIAAMAGGAYVVQHHMRDVKPPMPIAAAWKDATKDMTPESRERITALIKQAALSGEPDMNKARDLRADASRLAASDPYDAAKISALSDEARGYEDQARAKVENALIQGMVVLSPTERKLVANHLLRASFRFRFFLMKPGDGQDSGAAHHDGPPEQGATKP